MPPSPKLMCVWVMMKCAESNGTTNFSRRCLWIEMRARNCQKHRGSKLIFGVKIQIYSKSSFVSTSWVKWHQNHRDWTSFGKVTIQKLIAVLQCSDACISVNQIRFCWFWCLSTQTMSSFESAFIYIFEFLPQNDPMVFDHFEPLSQSKGISGKK